MNPLIIIDFLKSKIGQYVLISLVLSIALFYAYNHIYDKGYNKAVADIKIEEQKAINKALDEQKTRLKKEKEDAVKVAESMQKIQTVYIDRVKTVNQIISNSSVLSSKDCVMKDDELKDLNKLLVTP